MPMKPIFANEMLKGPVHAEVLRIIDGDTIDVRAQIWIGQSLQTRVRLAKIDAPELRGRCAKEKKLAQRAHHYLAQRLENPTVILKNIQLGKYGGRILAEVETAKGENLAELLLQNGLARPYLGQKRTQWCR
ncbi:thermonuclease family protein [Candidatus Terasakiella magnetica]|nr:thermonuclease family protein [Candidatus Terasakiella magnetica]